jgi:hypothetical protein
VQFGCSPDGRPSIQTASITGSHFPTHRLFVNGRPIGIEQRQGGLARLWYSNGDLIE